MTEPIKRGPGRPKNWLNDLPEHIKSLSGVPDNVTDRILECAKQFERLLREGEPRGVPTQLLAELNDLDDLKPKNQRTVLVDYRSRIAKIKEGQKVGAESTQQKAHCRGFEICDMNKALIQRIKPNGLETVHSVAKRIRDEWEKRGTGDTAPSINTLSTHIKLYRQGQLQR